MKRKLNKPCKMKAAGMCISIENTYEQLLFWLQKVMDICTKL